MSFKKHLIFFLQLFCIAITSAQLKVGDSNISFDKTKFDSNWPQMERWSKAGVLNGIPSINNIELGIKVTAFTASGINDAIKKCPSGKYVFLPNGSYLIDESIQLKSNVFLIGESVDSVICNITMTDKIAFQFYNINNSGIYNLTIQGAWGNPKYNWNISSQLNDEMPNNTNISVKFSGTTKNCWLDNVNIYNSALHPLVVNGTHITIRSCKIIGVHKKAGGYQGYFHVGNSDNLIYDNYVTYLRHISCQNPKSKYNVFYKNKFDQEFSFHTNDGGNNLIEQNKITLPKDMPNKTPNYFALMGPWSVKHKISIKPNYIYKNTIVELNHKNATPWSNNSKIYYGPFEIKPKNPYLNFKAMDSIFIPTGGTLYPVILK
ncbi:hypothetical protein BW723_16850 [Polaribacter reichenbachii]|uniref:Uncharacterized protein n=1 Tax=Polaribacter reichenbachii TaxID=996801 RepID=A0A1B8U5Q6_9FLAO|nr:glycosyl hydrolase family 28-related protein [Polaribacter reichenbachii]APZ47859.1 hypothetical protein BW723_16850 [Polaribacter reichenbachii]AUC18493.1 hypothetical protein BTO17_07245 [Polaribacter reichenbachii]OBY67193.1 hypothetical protein LPB301_03405 [Polaribacter reichenbachii]